MARNNPTHEIADCLDCGERRECEGARKWAYQHNISTGHRTTCEVAVVYRYG